MTISVYLSLGTNLGNRELNLQRAVLELSRLLQIEAVSPVYETDPVGVLNQPRFLNLVLGATTDVEPDELLNHLKQIERDIGRRPTYRWGPRVVDIDILLYGDRVIDTPELTIPHREMHRRAFVLVPLAEIAPDLVHPVLRTSIAKLADKVGDATAVRRLGCLADISPPTG